LTEAFGGFQPVEHRQSQVHDDDVWMKFEPLLDGFGAVARFANHFELGSLAKVKPDTFPNEGVVIDN
jgi:hypothetical protein